MNPVKKTVFGTKEWASHNVNVCKGCQHDCLYCYAKFNAVKRYKTIAYDKWTTEVINPSAIIKTYPKYHGTVMFPTTHDITPGNIEACMIVLHKLLMKGNKVLIVNKPHFECVKRMCGKFVAYKNQIIFRFTICASDDAILKYWEPNAPSFEERLKSLKYAFDNGYETSVSMEPCLDWDNVVENFHKFVPYVTNSIWIGTMNYIDERVEVLTEKDRQMVDQMKAWMKPETFKRVYEELKNHPLIKWKESMKKALGLKEVEEIGKDE